MLREFSSLLGLFFFTAGVVAIASLTKPSAGLPAAPCRLPGPDAVRARFLALESPGFHARFSLN